MGLCTSRKAPEATPEPANPAVSVGFLEFPPAFVLGSGTAAYQIEGGAAEGGRSPSIWDDFAHTEGKVLNNHNGDVACDHFHRFKEDVELMASLGLQAYRFSISWSRLIPDGEGEVNSEGERFYSELIDALLERGITPWVTLYHWDLPSKLEEEVGGWLGPKERLTAAFGNFARVCFARFGGRVKHWITFNEPLTVALQGYIMGKHAPGHTEAPETEPYIFAHNQLLAHAEAVRIYREEFAASQSGLIGLALNTASFYPVDAGLEEDWKSCGRAFDFAFAWFADPIFLGDYPSCMRETLGPRLPSFTEHEAALLKGSCDFLGINCYSSVLTRFGPLTPVRGWFADMGVDISVYKDPAWEVTDTDWNITPWGLRGLLQYVHGRYKPSHGVWVTENGCAHEPDGEEHFDAEAAGVDTFDDQRRVRFLRAHLSAVHAAIASGADVRGYFVWSTLDNFEWNDGYTKRFGIIRVDYRTQRRTIKASGRFLAEVIRRRGLDAPLKEEQYPGYAW